MYTGLAWKKYHSCIFGYFFINGLYSSSDLFFVCIVFFGVLSDYGFSGVFFGGGGGCRSVQTTGNLTAGMLSVLECAGHYALLTLHLSHPKHDWFDCSMSWRGPLSAPHGYIWSKVAHLQYAGRMQTTSSFFLMLCILWWVSYCPAVTESTWPSHIECLKAF